VAQYIASLFIVVVSGMIIWKRSYCFGRREFPCIECMRFRIFVEVTTLENFGIFILLFLVLRSERVPLSTLNCSCSGTKINISQGKRKALSKGIQL
jgi:hypothetical protein